MANTIRIKRRGSGGATGAPSSLENAELAFNEADNILYYGKGTGGAGGTATSVEVIGGIGAFITISTAQAITGNKTFQGSVLVPTPSANTHAATKLYVDQAVGNVTLSNTSVAAGTYGNSTAVGTFSVDAQGRLTAASNTLIAVSTAMIADRAVTAVKLSNTAVAEGNYGNASTVGAFYVDAQGRLGSASNTAIAITASQVTDFNEASQDAYGSLVSGGTQNGITVTYDDANTKVNYSVANQAVNIYGDTGVTAFGVSAAGSGSFSVLTGSGLTSAVTTNTITLNLDNTAVTAGAYGSASAVGTFSVDAQGRLVAASNTAIAITASQITDRSSSLVTGLSGTTDQISVSSSSGAVTLSLPSNVTIANNLTVTGDLTVQGNTVTLNTETLNVEDKNIVLGNSSIASNTTADGGGITLFANAGGNKTFNWVNSTAAWTSSEDLNLLSGKVYEIGGNTVLSANTLGSGVLASSLTSVGTIATGVWNGTVIGGAYGGTGHSSYATGDLLYGYGSTLVKLTAGSSGQFLKVDGMGVPTWSDTVDGGTF